MSVTGFLARGNFSAFSSFFLHFFFIFRFFFAFFRFFLVMVLTSLFLWRVILGHVRFWL